MLTKLLAVLLEAGLQPRTSSRSPNLQIEGGTHITLIIQQILVPLLLAFTLKFAMRLLDAETVTLHSFTSNETPKYAILSHRWGDDEISFKELSNPNFGETSKQKAGYRKIVKACQQAQIDGHRWIWIDTCCIDKRSSSELQESINSMFQWYGQSEICYVFLNDVRNQTDMTSSEWFERGWTLQELLAPNNIHFFDQNWTKLGGKEDFLYSITQATGIGRAALVGRDRLDYMYSLSIAQRMSWASKRKVTVEEDMAYSLLGIFGVHMPMIYGEGGLKAFERLQEEIIRQSTDLSFLAWKPVTLQPSHSSERGCLAQSPSEFNLSSDILHLTNHPWPFKMEPQPFALDNRGIQLHMPIIKRTNGRTRYIGIIPCVVDSIVTTNYIGIPLRSVERGRRIFVRENDSLVRILGNLGFQVEETRNICLLRRPPKAITTTIQFQPYFFKSLFLEREKTLQYTPFNVSQPSIDTVPLNKSTEYYKGIMGPVKITSGDRLATLYSPTGQLAKLVKWPYIAVVVDIIDIDNFLATVHIRQIENRDVVDFIRVPYNVQSQQSIDLTESTPFVLTASLKWEHDKLIGRTMLSVNVELTNSSPTRSLQIIQLIKEWWRSPGHQKFESIQNFWEFWTPLLEYMGEGWLWLSFPLKTLLVLILFVSTILANVPPSTAFWITYVALCLFGGQYFLNSNRTMHQYAVVNFVTVWLYLTPYVYHFFSWVKREVISLDLLTYALVVAFAWVIFFNATYGFLVPFFSVKREFLVKSWSLPIF